MSDSLIEQAKPFGKILTKQIAVYSDTDTEPRIISASGQETAHNVIAYSIILSLFARKPGVLQEILGGSSFLGHPS